MNCKPGDMAIVIRDAHTTIEGHHVVFPIAGRIVQVVELDGCDWRIAEEMEIVGRVMCCSGGHVRITCSHLADDILRPLPPLSEDEHDQAEAGKPEQVTA